MLGWRLEIFYLGTKEGRMQLRIQYIHSAHFRPHFNIAILVHTLLSNFVSLIENL